MNMKLVVVRAEAAAEKPVERPIRKSPPVDYRSPREILADRYKADIWWAKFGRP